MLTKEEARAAASLMTDAELERTANQVTGRHDDQDIRATAAVLEQSRRNQAAQQAAQEQERADRERSAAIAAYEATGLKVADDQKAFDTWFADRKRTAAGQALDDARAAARYSYKRSF